jgi:hypothetical protein
LIQADQVHPTLAGTSDMRAQLGKQIFGFDPVTFANSNNGMTINTSRQFPQLVVHGNPSFVFRGRQFFVDVW